ncbi:MAG: hypothetical protein MZW92_40175 [Comamonadaceae bacterium]|nr:hypothetical protein [Comamonadaceae bacterium]
MVLGAISLDLFAVLLGGATALLPMFAKDILHVGPWGLGLLRAAPAVGALLMSVALSRWPVRRRSGPRAAGRGGGATAWRCWCFGLSTSFVAVAGGAGGERRRRHGERRHPPDAGAAGDARRHARPRQRGQLGLHRRLELLGEFRAGAVAAWLGPVGSVVAGALGTPSSSPWMRLFPGARAARSAARSAAETHARAARDRDGHGSLRVARPAAGGCTLARVPASVVGVAPTRCRC